MLVFDVLGVSDFDHFQIPAEPPHDGRIRSATCSASSAT